MRLNKKIMTYFKQYNKKEVTKAFLFLLPALVLGTLFIILPIALSIIYGFTDYYLLTPNETKFVGLKNFSTMLKDPMVIKAFINTAYFVIMVIPVQLGTALILAVLVNKKFKFNTLYRTAFYAPNIISLVVLSLLWNMLLSPNGGLINTLLQSIGLPAQPFLSSPKQAMPTIMFISSWQGAGFQMMIFLAGLSNIPTDQYEAADIDGANKWKQFLYITLPGLRPVAVFVLVTTIISAFKLIVQPMVMTGGGPLDSTLTIVYHIFNVGYKFRYVGYASAIALTFTIILLPISILQSKLGKEQ
ncbi:carbohydrate ABC transporter membrane protein 1, CUT1 family [Clostridium sp. USBA 49]|uniref:carbohydrate ABC transporter permease n=1 Tax=Clostridium TaxID=1485 RepID=UPI0009C92926|nr:MULTISPECIES: sugar ABC transporter permease [Clostridium]SKA85533.1 carbohydrate ABC transporter membrane protein 1, CUT1 family [Clostridium sp. USBA 49]